MATCLRPWYQDMQLVTGLHSSVPYKQSNSLCAWRYQKTTKLSHTLQIQSYIKWVLSYKMLFWTDWSTLLTESKQGNCMMGMITTVHSQITTVLTVWLKVILSEIPHSWSTLNRPNSKRHRLIHSVSSKHESKTYQGEFHVKLTLKLCQVASVYMPRC